MERLSTKSLQSFANNRAPVIEYFKDIPQAYDLIDKCTDSGFIDELCRKYHYPSEEKKPLSGVALKMKESMLCEAAFSYRLAYTDGDIPTASVVITLGEGIDSLQEKYTEAFMLSECYMAEVIAGELLLRSYPVCNERIRERFGMNVSRYLFLGSVPEHGINEIPDMLGRSGLNVTCNKAFCIIPKKSVVFHAVLTSDERIVCEGICVGCGRKDCQNRMKEDESRFGRVSDLAGVAFNYGYARIFGRKYT